MDKKQLPGLTIIVTDRPDFGVYVKTINGEKPDKYGESEFFFMPPGHYIIEAGYYGQHWIGISTISTEGTVKIENDFPAGIYRISADKKADSGNENTMEFRLKAE